MKLQIKRKNSDHIHNSVYSKMKLVSLLEAILKIRKARLKSRQQNIFFPVTQQTFCSEIEHSI